jgi:hypothetical protein
MQDVTARAALRRPIQEEDPVHEQNVDGDREKRPTPEV